MSRWTVVVTGQGESNGQVPVADGQGNFTWGAGGGGGGTATLAGDTDVSISSPASTQGLVYNGSVWVNQAIVNSFNGRTGSVSPGNADYLAVAAGGLTGATAAVRFVGGTSSGAPTAGTFAVGDFVIDRTGKVWICTTAGSPGTWTQVSGGGGSSTLAGDTDVTISSPAANQSLVYNGSRWVNQIPNVVPTSASSPVTTAAYTFVAADMGCVVNGNSASAQTFTVPSGLPVGSVWFVTQLGAGAITIAGSGVTLESNAGLATAGQYAEIGLRVVAANTVLLTGNLSGSQSGFANPMTTAGDLITGGAAGAAQRLGIGSNSYVLTVVSGAPAWAAASGGGGTRVGPVLSMYLATGVSAVGGGTPITWDTEVFNLNSSAWHSTTTNKDRITIPTGFTGYCRISGNLYITTTNPGSFWIGVSKNGTKVRQLESSINTNPYPYDFVIPVTAGDYAQVVAYPTNGATVAGAASNADTSWCDVQWFGP